MYYNIDDILCEETELQVVLKQDLHKGRYLNQDSQSEDLKADERLNLPFWMAESLGKLQVNDMPLLEIETPDYYDTEYQKCLEQDPTILSLSSKTAYFYELGSKFANLFFEEDLGKYLRKLHFHSYLKRAFKIMDIGKYELASAEQQIKILTDVEKQDFFFKRQIAEDYKRWADRLNKRSRGQTNRKQII